MLELMQPYWPEFLVIALAHLLAVASPGPDFAIVLKHSVTYGRRCAIYTSLGVGTAILLHIAYTLIGIGLLLSQTPWLFNLFKIRRCGVFGLYRHNGVAFWSRRGRWGRGLARCNAI